MKPPRSDALVFFGATGDLAFKQIFPALLALVKHDRLDMPVVTTGRKDIGVDAMRTRMKESLTTAGVTDDAAVNKLAEQLRYVVVDYDDPKTFDGIAAAIAGAKHPLHYVALPPEVFEGVARNLAAAGLADGARLALEKPFGHDLASAKALSHALHAYFPEESLYRIDHFLGKEPVENIVYVRAANPFIEATLDRAHVASVQITMAETFGVKGRAKFYDSVGAIRDVVQNHLLELVACLTMELPAHGGHVALRAERSRLLSHIRALTVKDVVRGQVRGYKDEEGVDRSSTTETFAALRLHIDTPRWEGVPIHIRAGKSLAVTATEVLVRWKQQDRPVLDEHVRPASNHLRFRLGPDTVVALGTNVKKDGEAMVGEFRELELHRANKDQMKAYERLLGDAIDGDATLFAQKDAVEESWRVVDPIVGDATPVHEYEPGSWGPAAADTLAPPADASARRKHAWHNP